jgi:uncharacterized protein (TIGR03067 family)
MRISMLAVFGVCGLVFSGSLIAAEAQDDAEKELKKLSGVYIMVSGEANGEKLPEMTVLTSTLTLKGNKYTVKLGDDKFSGHQKLDPTKSPKEIDATDTDGANKGKTMLGIYKLEKGMFTVYFSPPGKDRPKEFAAKTNPGELIHVWKKK